MEEFKKLGLSEQTIEVLKRKGFEKPTLIQEKVIPAIFNSDKDIVGQAQTGTGKTAAFGLPIIELLKERSGFVSVLILTPTRELAIQVAEELNSLKGKRDLSIAPIYGGQSIDLQLRRLKKGVDIVVGTPGRVIDHIKRKTLKIDKVSYFVLDEADEMLNMGFIDDVKEIMNKMSSGKRVLLFSATMPNEILQIAKKYMAGYEVLRTGEGQLTVSQTEQIYFEVSEGDKLEALCRIIDVEAEFYGLVFCRTKVKVDMVASKLMERGYDADALHGDMSQPLRERILNKFKKRTVTILVATDVASRGIDVQDLTHVINYSIPQDAESYVHRIGRTGRAGKEGNAITFISPEEYRKLNFIKRIAQTDIRKHKLPNIKDVIETKKNRIKAQVESVVTSGIKDEYLNISRDLLKNNSPEDLLAALLEVSFKDELDENKYVEIEDAAFVDKKGKTRLFVGRGKQDGFNAKELAKIIKERCNIKDIRIHDIQILDRFSFITLPFNEAEKVLTYFKKGKNKSGMFIEKAQKRKKR
ncbi:MAG: DEAD/DEAH box helicase [Candidatus Kaelpia aquatica]|nr:DEAD/DEAH box helicase [Candidatus Kaelpia aquatica]